MFAFIFMGQLTRSGGQGLIPLLGVLMGACVFWIIGTQTGKPTTYACAGAILGLAIGMWLPRFSQQAGAVNTTLGPITARQLQQLVTQRQIANQFIQEAYRAGFPFPNPSESGGQQLNQLMMQFWQQGLQRVLFQINPRRPLEEDVVAGYLLRHEAEKRGVTVSDETITAHIKQVTRGKLSTQDFRKLIAHMRLTEEKLYEVLRDELLAQMALQLLVPPSPRTPEQYWEDCRKLNVTESLEVAAVSVDQFLSQVEEPSEGQLKDFFERNKDYFPGQRGPAEPGLRQPRKIRLAYLEADYTTVEEQVPDVTDDEVKQYYEDNKETLYRNLTLPEATDDKPTQKAADAATNPDSEGAQPDSPANTQETDDDSSSRNDAATKTPDSQEKSSEDGDATTTESTESRAESKVDAASDSSTPSPKKAESVDLTAESAENKSVSEALGGSPPPPPGPAKKPLKYRPLDKELKLDIHDQLKNERTIVAIHERVDAAITEMRELGYRYSAPEGDPERLDAEQVAERLRTFAQENGLRYAETPPLSAQEMQDSPDHPIGQAAEPADNPLERQNARSVVARLFETETSQLHVPDQAEDFVTNNRFAYWAIADIAEHVPTFDEPGIREQVLEAWKTIEARPIAATRAKELADAAREALQQDKKTLSTALADETTTGAEAGSPLRIVTTPEFSWLTRTASSAAPVNPLQPPAGPPVQFTDLAPLVEKAGNEFMEQLFDQLKPNEIGVIPNADQSVYYVVQVKQRTPSDSTGELTLRQAFLQENPFSSRVYAHLSDLERGGIYLGWLDQLERKYAVHWNRPAR